MPVSKPNAKEPMHHADILAALKKVNESYVSVAQSLDVHPTSVRNVARGAPFKSHRIARRIAELIDRDVDDIWPGVYDYEERESWKERCERAVA